MRQRVAMLGRARRGIASNGVFLKPDSTKQGGVRRRAARRSRAWLGTARRSEQRTEMSELYSMLYRGLGDCWVGCQWLLANTTGEVRLSTSAARDQITCRHKWFNIAPKLREILALLDGTDRIKLVDECGGFMLEPEKCCLAPVVPVREKFRWRGKGGRVAAYHFTGLTDAARKNPPAADVDKFLTWLGENRYLPFDLGHDCFRLEDLALICQMSDFFLGCCSGPAHVAHSVGCPIHLVHYARDPKHIHHWHSGRQFTLHKTIGDFVDAYHQQPPSEPAKQGVPG